MSKCPFYAIIMVSLSDNKKKKKVTKFSIKNIYVRIYLHPDWLWGPPSLLYNEYQRLFPWG
jgi:hypothetical protein